MPYDDYVSDQLRREAGVSEDRPQFFYRDGTEVSEKDVFRIQLGARGNAGAIYSRAPCSRCGGRGGSEAWKFTGFTCYRCGGRNSMAFETVTRKVYTQERLAQLQAAADKKAAKNRAETDRKAAKRRAEFIAWAKPHGKLIGRILLAAKPQGDTGEFITDLAGKLRKHWNLSEKQLAAAAKVLDAREQRKAQDIASEHVGSIKERIDFEGKIEFTTERDGYYGITTIVKFRDFNGNVFTWFASGVQDLARGDRVKVRGTVKKHEVYQGVKQTILSRCKIKKFEIMTADEAAQTEAVI